MAKVTWVTIPQAAKRTDIPLRTVYRWAYQGRVPYRQSVRTEGYSKVALEAVEQLAQARKGATDVHSEVSALSRAGEAGPTGPAATGEPELGA